MAAAAVALDQLTKAWALAALPERPIAILPTVRLRLTYNSGFSFGLGAEYGVVVAVVVLVIACLLARAALREHDPVRAIIIAVVLGGALGNIVDRVIRADAGPLSGAVVDFVAVTWFAVFNVADMFVVCGALLLALTDLRRAPDPEPNAA
ncbi:MAG TPA: signal peptidase II [Euzebyales bacterium]|nr:signal peptidase II [Euzebyales bacterium]